MKRLRSLSGIPLFLLPHLASAAAPTVTPILENGPDTAKKVIVVVGDGFTEAELPAYRQYVQDTIINGVFANDEFLRSNHSAFNVYRADVTSNVSGVSVRRYSAGCSTNDTSADDVIDTSCSSTTPATCFTHDTPFDYVYTGCWGRCWIEPTATTNASVKAVLDTLVPKRDLEIRVVNVTTGGSGGCTRGANLVVTTSTPWTTVAHEMGHMAGGLLDEYGSDTSPHGTLNPPNSKNCSTVLSRTGVWWADLIAANTPVATTFDALTMDPDDTVGEFEGCHYHTKGIWRPVSNCRMKGNVNQYCPVCTRLFTDAIAGFPDTGADYAFFANYAAATCRPASGTPTYEHGAAVSNRSTATATLVCPTRRVQSGSTLTNRLFGEAFVVNQNPTGSVCCQVFARTPQGNLATGPNVCTTGASASYRRLKLDLPKVRMDYTFAHFAMKCTIPPAVNGAASQLITYRIVQQYY